jgi:AcrR family transcriptional regulator
MAKKLNQTQFAIINAAQIVFARYGYRKTTVDDIAQEAHIAKSSIYRYFKTKEEIFETIVEKEADMWLKRIQKAIAVQKNPKDKLRAYVLTKTQILKTLKNFYHALKDEYLEHYESIERLRKKYAEKETKLVERILRNGVKKGVFVIEDLKLSSFALVTGLKGMEIILLSENGATDFDKSVDSLLHMLFYGIAKK